MRSRPSPDWERYERMVARMATDQVSTDMCVTPNAYVRGRISGRKRQIDVLVDARHDTDNSRRLIVDAKHRKRKVDVNDVESFPRPDGGCRRYSWLLSLPQRLHEGRWATSPEEGLHPPRPPQSTGRIRSEQLAQVQGRAMHAWAGFLGWLPRNLCEITAAP